MKNCVQIIEIRSQKLYFDIWVPDLFCIKWTIKKYEKSGKNINTEKNFTLAVSQCPDTRQGDVEFQEFPSID